ncbi:MAG: iron-containing alcohol dehydrogenase [Actinomycetes bacterium]|jgi:alcohol dehydrogenase class IV/choline kinase|nr:iron-containing alcohol dehydrogenase [Actinomycetes bacterium]
MKAVIFNSGIGKRMGEFTRTQHKSMARLANGETLFARQLRLLRAAGIRDFVVTTGPFADQLQQTVHAARYADCRVTFVENPDYATTNYIVSMHRAAAYLDDDLLFLHGDLVFDADYPGVVMNAPYRDLGSVNTKLSLPEKDFKARVIDGRVREVSVGIFGDDCVAFQPFYKLSRATAAAWLARVADFVAAGNTQVYAENALNELLADLPVHAFSYADHYVEEIDTTDDLARVSAAIRDYDFAQQPTVTDDTESALQVLLDQVGAVTRPMLVAGIAPDRLGLTETLDRWRSTGAVITGFSNFSPNPTYEQVAAGVRLFRDADCDALVSLGGGSAIDTAKCIKLYGGLDLSGDTDLTDAVPLNVPHIAIPTTAGTGSEATRFAVIYRDGAKQSVTHDGIVPDAALLDAALLAGLPDYQRKATLLDALAQAIESWWSVNSTPQSIDYSRRAIALILPAIDGFLAGDDTAASAMLQAANLAGRAINLTQTTAAHAMSYKVTSLMGPAHGHAVALCLPGVWRYAITHPDACIDSRGGEYLARVLDDLAASFGVATAADAPERFAQILAGFDLPPVTAGPQTIEILCASVNSDRLRNFPIRLSADAIRAIYTQALSTGAMHE